MEDNSRQDSNPIGQKLKDARQQQQLSLRELAERAEVSASLLSKIENGKAMPSVRSLHSIADALSLPVNYFFLEDPQYQSTGAAPAVAETASEPPPPSPVAEVTPGQLRTVQAETALDKAGLGFDKDLPYAKEPVVRASTRQSIELLGGIIWERLTPTAEGGAEFLQIYYEVGAASDKKMSHHSGREFQFVLEGELKLELGFECYLLKAGDSIIFDSTTPHRLSNAGTVPMRALSVIFNREP